jgi:Cytochrome c554 and c-prime
MTNRSRCLALAIVAALGAVAVNSYFAVGGGPQGAPDARMPVGVAVRADTDGRIAIAGNVSCGGRACHGGLEANVDLKRLGQNEFTQWVAHDKHADAYRVLFEERADHMAAKLAGSNKDGKKIPAHEDARCLACHATPQLTPSLDTTPGSPVRDVLLFDGVGCESCHGAARGAKPWLQTHLQFKDFRNDPKALADRYDEVGMTYLQDPGVQAKVCVACHVGSAADPKHGTAQRDAFHDIMAAGHPRLTFEFTAYHDNMPPHWRTETPRRGTDAQSWALGQLITARATLLLLDDRANRPNAPWPEFAEYDCFSCHAGLTEPSWRLAQFENRKKKGLTPGTPPYSVWCSTMLPYLTPTADPAVSAAFESLSKAMSRPSPDVKTIGDETKKALAALYGLAKKVRALKYNNDDIAAILKRILPGDKADIEALTWDEVQQLTLAIAALKPTLAGKGKEQLDDITRLLAYPPGRESPSLFRHDTKLLDQKLFDLRQSLP